MRDFIPGFKLRMMPHYGYQHNSGPRFLNSSLEIADFYPEVIGIPQRFAGAAFQFTDSKWNLQNSAAKIQARVVAADSKSFAGTLASGSGTVRAIALSAERKP